MGGPGWALSLGPQGPAGRRSQVLRGPGARGALRRGRDRQRAVQGRRKGGAVRLQDLFLRAGHEHHPGQERGEGLGHRDGGDGAHLEGGLHHPRRFPGRHQAGVRPEPGSEEPAPRPMFAQEIVQSQESWRRVVAQAIQSGISVSGISSSLGYFDAYRRERLPANLVQAQRDFFGSHTYERLDREGWFHTLWSDSQSADSITTSGYNN